MSLKRPLLIVCLASLLFCFGCPPPAEPGPKIAPPIDYGRQLPPGELALVKLDPSEYPDFSEGFYAKAGLEQAARYSLDYLSHPSSQNFYPYGEIPHDRVGRSIEAFLEVLKSSSSPEDFDAKLKERFDVYMSRGCDEKGTVLFTGYYRPIFDCRLQPDGEFKFPLYKRPPDLKSDPITGKYESYLTREEIDRGALTGKNLELCYLRDRFEAYIVTVQGSGKLRLPDGKFFEIGYAGDNGQEYTSVGKQLVEQNLLPAQDLSLQGLIRYFREHPEHLDRVLAANKRYVFFTPREGGPYGSLNVPVTPYYSIATDKEVYPRAAVSFMTTNLPARGADGRIGDYAYRGFAMDQDTGGAIRAAGRCDIFLGTGPEVGELAGRTLAEGKLYYIFVKE